jgi:hypothetical protein
MFSSSISFLHLNIQSLVPKLDLITAEYADFDILSFSESWLNRSNIALILEVIDKTLILDCTSVIESVGGFGPGLVSTPAIIRRKTITAH